MQVMLLAFSQQTRVLHKKKHGLTSFCILDTVTDFKLDPPTRAKSQAAPISVTGVIDTDDDSVEQPVKVLLVDNVQLLTPQEAGLLKDKCSTLIYFAALAGQVSRKRDREPGDLEDNPAKASTCRNLSRSPTGPPLPDYSSSSRLESCCG